MNRLVSPLEKTLPNSLNSPSLQHLQNQRPPTPISSQCGNNLATFAPIHYEQSYAYPLLIWLHGRGGDERQLLQLMPLVSMRNHVAVAPRGTVACRDDQLGFSWSQSSQHVERAEQRLFECVDEARRRFNVHTRRVFIAGYDCGGTMALRLAWRHPDRFAGAATIGGPLPEGHRPLARVNELRQLPMLISAGRDACGYHQQRLCDDLRLLHSAGFSVALRQYPCGDELCSMMLADLDRWMMEIVCGKNVATSPR